MDGDVNIFKNFNGIWYGCCQTLVNVHILWEVIQMNWTTCKLFLYFNPGQPHASISVKLHIWSCLKLPHTVLSLKGKKWMFFFSFVYKYLLKAVLALCSLYSSDRALVRKCFSFLWGLFGFSLVCVGKIWND